VTSTRLFSACRAASLGLAVTALLAACGSDTSDTPGTSDTVSLRVTVVKGPVLGGSVCGFRLDAAGAVAAGASGCELLDRQGSAVMQLPGSTAFLLKASGLRYRDESAAGAETTLEGVLESIATTPAAGSPQRQLAITPLTHVAVASLRERATALSGPAFEAMLDRVAAALGLSGAQVRAVPAFDAAGQPTDLAASTIAAFSDMGREQGTGVSAQLARFAREFAKPHPDDALSSFNRELRAALRARLDFQAALQATIYGYAGTAGPGAPIDGERRCSATAYGVWTSPLNFEPEPARFELCIAMAPAGASCDAAFLGGLDFSGVDTRYGSGNYSGWVFLQAALAAFTTDTGRYRLEFASRCGAFPTLEATLSRGKLYRPGFLAPME
jgi:hypothetical protein